MKRAMYMLLFISGMILVSAKIEGQTSIKETRNVSGYSEISFGIAGNLYVKTGPDFSLTMEGEKRYIQEIETIVKDGRLIIRTTNFRLNNNEKAEVRITLPELKRLGVSGSGTAQVENGLKNDALELNVSGSGKVIVPDVVTGKLRCSISGSGNILLKGSGEVDKGDISISGSGNYTGTDAVIKSLAVGISGSGNCSCNVSESIDASISGSGNVSYSGNPKVNARISGSGHVRSR
jgi:hypothetical protein